MRVGLVQLTSGDIPSENLTEVSARIREAAAQGAQFVITPEVTNCVSLSRSQQASVLQHEEDDITLAALRELAAELDVHLLIGSLAIKTHDADGRFANRSYLITSKGEIAAHYDKIHMFDVELGNGESYCESAGYRPGERAVVADVDGVPVGMAICYDVRFAYLFRALAKAGARILTLPAAFAVATGRAHWEVLLRARAIETGCFVLAAGQTGTHHLSGGKTRQTWGHSMVVSPWGEVLLDAGEAPGVHVMDLDLTQVDKARAQVPSLTHDRSFEGPEQ